MPKIDPARTSQLQQDQSKPSSADDAKRNEPAMKRSGIPAICLIVTPASRAILAAAARQPITVDALARELENDPRHVHKQCMNLEKVGALKISASGVVETDAATVRYVMRESINSAGGNYSKSPGALAFG